MAMTNEEWAEYQRKGLHLRPEQRTEEERAALKGEQTNAVNNGDANAVSAPGQLGEIINLLSSIKSMLKFFVVLAVIGLCIGFLDILVSLTAHH